MGDNEKEQRPQAPASAVLNFQHKQVLESMIKYNKTKMKYGQPFTAAT
jgi:hypothetical protein